MVRERSKSLDWVVSGRGRDHSLNGARRRGQGLRLAWAQDRSGGGRAHSVSLFEERMSRARGQATQGSRLDASEDMARDGVAAERAPRPARNGLRSGTIPGCAMRGRRSRRCGSGRLPSGPRAGCTAGERVQPGADRGGEKQFRAMSVSPSGGGLRARRLPSAIWFVGREGMVLACRWLQ